jgi:NDP-sugar pyrophosphorylase family protein
MKSDSNLGAIKAVLLVGGMGTRLRSVIASTPKPLASLGQVSFLELLIRQLRSQGVVHLVMCTGYMGEQIETEFGNGSALGVSIQYSKELQPLGTAGALKLASPFLHDATPFFVMNGDSFMETDFGLLLQMHQQQHGLVTIAVRHVEDAARYGTVELDSNLRVLSFNEKTGKSSPGLVNAGVYVFDPKILEQIPPGKCSLEEAVFPSVIDQGIYAKEQSGLFIDIGTPEDYARAQEICDQLAQAAGRPIH